MSNWCYQNLVISGSYAERQDFLKTLGVTRGTISALSFNPFFISNDDDADVDDISNDDDADVDDEFRIKDIQVHYSTTRIQTNIYFESAWEPAIELVRRLSVLFPALTFGVSYSEESYEFLGWQVFNNGIQVESFTYNLSLYSDEMSLLELQYERGDIYDEEWYEAFHTYNEELISNAGADCSRCTNEHAKWVKNEQRRLQQGKRSREFIYDHN